MTFFLLAGAMGCAPAAPRVETAPVPAPPGSALAPSSGGGAYPLTPEVAALWLSRGGKAGETPQPFVMVFYAGPSGWHDKQWQVADDYGNPPSFIKMTSPELTLSLEESADGVIRIQREVVDLSVANIFQVRQIDGQMSAVQVIPVGWLRLPIPADAIPPVFVLDSQREIAARVLEAD